MPGVLNGVYHNEEFQRCWPSWQEEIEGRSLVHVEVPCSIESLFEALFHSNAPFQVDIAPLFQLVNSLVAETSARRSTNDRRARESLGGVSLGTTQFTVQFQLDRLQHKREQDAQTYCRDNSESTQNGGIHLMASRCCSRVLVMHSIQPLSARNKLKVVDATHLAKPSLSKFAFYLLLFTATVSVLLYNAISIDSGRCCLSIDYQLIYIEKVNFVLRRFIEGSARSGIEDNFQKWLEALREFYLPLEVIDLKSEGGKRIQKSSRQRKELKSHKLDDLTEEYVEYEDLELSSESSDLTMLTIVLLFVRFVIGALALLHWCLDGVMFIPRKLASLVYWSTVLNWVLTGLIAFSAYLVLSQQLIGLLEGLEGGGSCVSFGNLVICFAVSITTGFLMQAFRAPSHLNSRKKRTPQITQDATGLQAVARDPTNHKIPPLHVLCCQENVAAAAELIAQGADVNETDTMGNTALHVAAAHGCQEAMILLIGNGANPTLCNKNGRRPSDVVCAKLNDKRKRHAISGLLSLSEMRFEVDNRNESFDSLHEPYCLEDLINSRLRIAETTRRFETATKHRRNNDKFTDQCTSPVLHFHH